MEILALALGLALPWCLGFALRLALFPPQPAPAGTARIGYESLASHLGCGYFVGLLLLTLWMRVLSTAGIGFGRLSIGAPLFAATVALGFHVARGNRLSLGAVRDAANALFRPPLPSWQRIAWTLLLAWLALRVATLAVEIAWRPLYPWDAWTQWATKARVWYELGRIASFAPADVWLAGGSDAYFDAAPGAPATIPLVQVWSAVALGHWDDSATNWPWLLMLVALALAVYGALRDASVPPLGALIGAYFIASLPLLDTHVALAGYADLMLSGVYTLSALALHRWTVRRDSRHAALALFLALACPLIAPAGIVWTLTLVPGAIVALWPRQGLKIVAWTFGTLALAVLVLAQSAPTLFGYRLHLDYRPPWGSLVDAYLLFGNWHLLWYGAVALAIVGARRLLRPPLAPLVLIVASGLAFVFVGFTFTNLDASADLAAINRATLHVAPLLACLCVLVWQELTTRGDFPAPAASVADETLHPATATDA